ncbi:DNA translocase FtsK, partial [Candidatus Roizmanbacteria bacterium]|nr:DNA translocase FtsK [Candidatus Roizmanbacteria bacterium]
MARTKSLFRIPFLKIKINRRTIFSILGFLFIASGLLLLVSFFASDSGEGRILYLINQYIFYSFDFFAFFSPFIVFLFGAHFFSSKKLKFIKPNITIGAVLIFLSFLGIFQSGSWGQFIFENLSADFSFSGALIILSITFFIGLILFLDTSVDSFVMFLVKTFTGFFRFLRNFVFREMFEKKGRPELEKAEDKFIRDFEIKKAKTQEVRPISQVGSEMRIRPAASSSNWVYPPITILQDVSQKEADRGDVKKNADTIEKTLESFGIRARVAEVNYGPTVTQYALEITLGTKLSKITGLSHNLALSLAAPTGQVRIEAPIPGRSMVGIEVPNIRPEIVTLKKLLTSPLFKDNPDPLLVPLGLDVSGKPTAATIEKMP